MFLPVFRKSKDIEVFYTKSGHIFEKYLKEVLFISHCFKIIHVLVWTIGQTKLYNTWTLTCFKCIFILHLDISLTWSWIMILLLVTTCKHLTVISNTTCIYKEIQIIYSYLHSHKTYSAIQTFKFYLYLFNHQILMHKTHV